MNKLIEIYEGWKNFIVRKVEIELLSKDRLAICKSCEHYKLKICTKCTCPGAGKSRSPNSSCPIGKWPELTAESSSVDLTFDEYIPSVPMNNFENSDSYITYLNDTKGH